MTDRKPWRDVWITIDEAPIQPNVDTSDVSDDDFDIWVGQS